MLVWPHQMWLTGITAGIILEVVAGFWNIWTMCALPHKRFVCLVCSRAWCEGLGQVWYGKITASWLTRHDIDYLAGAIVLDPQQSKCSLLLGMPCKLSIAIQMPCSPLPFSSHQR